MIFSVLDCQRRRDNRDRDIPWTWLNICKLIVVLFLICICCIDFGTMIKLRKQIDFYDVQYTSIVVKFITFVSTEQCSLSLSFDIFYVTGFGRHFTTLT